MNCRQFEIQMADWVSRRLPEPLAALMEQHKNECPRCARLAEGEAALQRAWADWGTATEMATRPVELSSRAFDRITQPASRPFVSFPGSRWTFAAAGALAVIIPVVLVLPINSQRTTNGAIPPKIVPVQPAVTVQPTTNWVQDISVFDVSESNPSVDDPVGNSMEPVWTHVNQDISDRTSQ